MKKNKGFQDINRGLSCRTCIIYITYFFPITIYDLTTIIHLFHCPKQIYTLHDNNTKFKNNAKRNLRKKNQSKFEK